MEFNNFHFVAKEEYKRAIRKAWAGQSRRITDIIKEYSYSYMKGIKNHMLDSLESEGFQVEFILEENSNTNEYYMIFLEENSGAYFIFGYEVNEMNDHAICDTFNTYQCNNNEVHYLDFLQTV